MNTYIQLDSLHHNELVIFFAIFAEHIASNHQVTMKLLLNLLLSLAVAIAARDIPLHRGLMSKSKSMMGSKGKGGMMPMKKQMLGKEPEPDLPEPDLPTTDLPKTVVDIAVGAGGFGALVDALVATGLDEVLLGEGPFTVFAPTDEAFAGIESVVAGLSEEELKNVLLYHVVVGSKVFASDLKDGQDVTMANGSDVQVALGDPPMLISANSKANIILTDLEAQNGVVHVIDTVLLP